MIYHSLPNVNNIKKKSYLRFRSQIGGFSSVQAAFTNSPSFVMKPQNPLLFGLPAMCKNPNYQNQRT